MRSRVSTRGTARPASYAASVAWDVPARSASPRSDSPAITRAVRNVRAASTEAAYHPGIRSDTTSFGSEALAGVESDALAIEHRVLDDGEHELGVLVGPSHPLGEGSVLRERQCVFVGDALRDAGREEAR